MGCQSAKEELEINILSNSVIVDSPVNKEKSKINQSFNSVFVNLLFISTPATLLAWCSYDNNSISVIDLETKQNYVTFDGAKISGTGKC